MSSQTIHNTNYAIKQYEKGLCRFCRNKRLENQKTCTICYLKIMSKNNLNSRDYHEQLYKKLIDQDFKCYITGRLLTLGDNASLDHVIPKSKNKMLGEQIDNIRWCDKSVNFIKRDLEINELIKLCKEILNHQGN